MINPTILPSILSIDTKKIHSIKGCLSIFMHYLFKSLLTLSIGIFVTFFAYARPGIILDRLWTSAFHSCLYGIGSCIPHFDATSILSVRMLPRHADTRRYLTATVHHIHTQYQSQSQNGSINWNDNLNIVTGIEFISYSCQSISAIFRGERIQQDLSERHRFVRNHLKLLFRTKQTSLDIQGAYIPQCSLSDIPEQIIRTNPEVKPNINEPVLFCKRKSAELFQSYGGKTYHAEIIGDRISSNPSRHRAIVSHRLDMIQCNAWEFPAPVHQFSSDTSPCATDRGMVFDEDLAYPIETDHISGLTGSIIHRMHQTDKVRERTIGYMNTDIETTCANSVRSLCTTECANRGILFRGLQKLCAPENSQLTTRFDKQNSSPPLTRSVVAGHYSDDNYSTSFKKKIQFWTRIEMYQANLCSVFSYIPPNYFTWKSFCTGQIGCETPSSIDMRKGACSILVNTVTGLLANDYSVQETRLSVPNLFDVSLDSISVSCADVCFACARREQAAICYSCHWSSDGRIREDNCLVVNNPSMVNTDYQLLSPILCNGKIYVDLIKQQDTSKSGSLDQTSFPSVFCDNGAPAVQLSRDSSNYIVDKVFSAEYRLMPLSEVKDFITKNGHLPNVPSESEVKKKGVDLQEMQTVLLRKVEELTLHVIAIEEENNKLRRRIETINASLPINDE